MKVSVSSLASEEIRSIARYIQQQFGKRYRIEFRKDLEHKLRLLEENPHLGPVEPLLTNASVEYRSVVVNRLNKLVYWVNEDTIEVVDFWDVRREPSSLAERVSKK